jgi:indolepyruvate ferredoxin oxidoreductase beta subunit
MPEITNILICGTGGQGILLASEVISGAALLLGLDVRKSEVHGMAQRGGSVVSHVRFGPSVSGSLVEEGAADLVLALEKLEALRWMHFLSPSGRLLSTDLEILPLTVSTGKETYPDVEAELRASGVTFRILPARSEAEALGDNRVVNTFMLGAASTVLPLDREAIVGTMTSMLPGKAREVNLKAFERGRALAGE